MKLALIAVIMTTVLAILVVRLAFSLRSSKGQTILLKTTLFVSSLFYSLIAAELAAYLIVVRSDGMAFTLGAQRWFAEYWHPINAFGYRDEEHVADPSKKNLFVVGDSFVAGHGIAEYRRRFSNVLAQKLGEEWTVWVIAKNGWHTGDELLAIQSHPTTPDFILLSYFVNDIEGAAEAVGIHRPQLVASPPPWLRQAVDRSYLANWLYWDVYRRTYATEIWGEYHRFLQSCFRDEKIWNRHREQLLDMADYSRSRSIGFGAVVFPNPADVEGTAHFAAQVVGVFRDISVEVVDLTSQLAGRDSRVLVVNTRDAHPNETIHREVGELLYQHFFERRR